MGIITYGTLSCSAFLCLALKIRKRIIAAKPYKDSDDLKIRAANTVGLPSKRIHIAVEIYTVSENELCVNIPSLCNAVNPYLDMGQNVEEVWFQSNLYAMDMDIGDNTLVENEQAYVEYTLLYSELKHSSEEYQYFSLPQKQNESTFIYSFIARWL